MAHVAVNLVYTFPSVLTRHALTFINFGVTQPPVISGFAQAGERGNAINAGTIVAGVRMTVVYVSLAVLSRKTFSTLAGVGVRPIYTLGAILAWCTGTFVYIVLTLRSVKTCRAFTVKLVDFIDAFAIV